MSVKLTPGGTRGAKMPNFPRPIMKLLMIPFNIMMRRRGAQLLELTTVGAKSGNEHAVTLRWFPDGKDAWLIVASYGGAAKHPAWYVNMAKNPDKLWINLGQGKRKVNAESLQGSKRTVTWRRIIAKAPGYSGYEEKTDREIPVVRLTAA